ncbi:ArsR/SmtB family transcription factor [Phenylobacterium sp.]|jgi:DNA-binding transcriptional ArsR family regulator|uniref:ArsR/SmtB family transcription factor n=1 Tax=Phenylobacterium sp. TaxID=1871053 RepID=UPI0037CA5919
MGVSGAAVLDRTLAALADPARRRAVELLTEGPRAAGELARALNLSPPSMSRHLRTLREAGLVRESHSEFDARVRIYELRAGPIAELKLWLEASERLWTTQLAAFKAQVERDA